MVARTMTTLPTVPFGPVDVTRLIIGGNPLCGNSHFDETMSRQMREYHTAENVVATLQACQAAGINAVQARGDYHRVLHWMELFRREGGQLHWIAQTASEMHDIPQNIRILAAAGAVGIYYHGSRTDRLWKAGQIDTVLEDLKCARDCGVQVGLGSHMPEVFEYVEDHGWDVDFYMTCLYNLSREDRESALVGGDQAAAAREKFAAQAPPRMMQVIQGTEKTCLAFKILAASRRCGSQQEVADAFRYAFDNIKPGDAIVVGMYQEHLDQVSLNVEHTRAALRNPA
ncbi:MAG: hypothetical protein CME04_23090 [Gemmatimonadaceae bacterium]|nr:hypothetical protein [Gemmatimonadaceae bacterium]